MVVDRELRRLTRAVANPDYDGRRKYSYEKIKIFPEGTTFIGGERWEDARGYPHPASADGVSTKFWIIGTTAQMLIDASEPVTPNTWNEFRMSWGDSNEDGWTNRTVLEKLWSDPAMREPMMRAFKEAMEDE